MTTNMDQDALACRDEAQALAHLRKESLDVYNRIHSISEDIDFVNSVHAAYPHLPVLPNLRCGAWYVDPRIARQEPAYYKSTDGHFGNWSFNLRRPNLHLLSIVVAEGGLILVDSTRSGKRIPDALSKTVPIWCAVINRAVQRRYPSREKDSWDTQLYCPPGAVSAQEVGQISTRLDSWVDSLLNSAYIISDLLKPLRPLWLTPATSTFPQLARGVVQDFYPILCVSASRQPRDGMERRAGGYAYVQGSGDDHELWGMGLTPQLFWTHRDTLLAASRVQLPAHLASLVRPASPSASLSPPAPTSPRARPDTWRMPPTSIAHVGARIALSALGDLPSPLPSALPSCPPLERAAYVLISPAAHTPDAPAYARETAVLQISLAAGKKDQLYFLQAVLPRAAAFAGAQLAQGARVCVCCESGGDASVGVALAVLQLFFDDMGSFVRDPAQQSVLRSSATKQSISKRLQWIISSRPQANPSRATLKRVNEYILTSPSFRRQRHA
ncbi:initiator tRNA phosphoribosyl transferase [Wolfiporia cocos MD-104 SS10]|uniref:Initiator tRNA phosphoribosyl transferase n=1 Tax=Wolfiporia cocos (strain MD-104) TaxID=742152 RepID=A0A2H3J362_WOLCO|nr:initiator tRNA phosphoribosyl transferase [Wolfiporia cocos MD-104 SS10]